MYQHPWRSQKQVKPLGADCVRAVLGLRRLGGHNLDNISLLDGASCSSSTTATSHVTHVSVSESSDSEQPTESSDIQYSQFITAIS